jgi:hypothetical protein
LIALIAEFAGLRWRDDPSRNRMRFRANPDAVRALLLAERDEHARKIAVAEAKKQTGKQRENATRVPAHLPDERSARDWELIQTAPRSSIGSAAPPKLRPMRVVGDPDADSVNIFARRNRRGMADDRHEVALAARCHLQDGEPILLIVKSDPFGRAGERFQ